MATILIVQWREFTSWTLAFTVAQVCTQTLLLYLGIKHGVGGFTRLDKATYVVFIIAITAYITTGDTFIGLLLLCTTDLVAFVPTLVKTWRKPSSETPIFFFGGAVSSLLAVFAANNITDSTEILFPVYIVFIDAFMVVLIYRQKITEVVFRRSS